MTEEEKREIEEIAEENKKLLKEVAELDKKISEELRSVFPEAYKKGCSKTACKNQEAETAQKGRLGFLLW